MINRPFKIGIIQETVSSDAARNVRDASEKIREAAARGANIVCLQELFNSPYFCKSQKCERFDIAEPIPGPTVQHMQALAKELGIVLIVPIFERQAAGVYRNSAAVVDGATWQRMFDAGRVPNYDLAVHDSYHALAAVGALLPARHTGANVADVCIGLVQ